MIKHPYISRTIRTLSDSRQAHDNEKMGVYYENDFEDHPAVVDLDRVVEYHGTKVCNAGAYTGANGTWLYFDDGSSTMLLEPFAKFHEAMDERIYNPKSAPDAE
jgi:hypothetical protein